jgi:hypothetical protein
MRQLLRRPADQEAGVAAPPSRPAVLRFASWRGRGVPDHAAIGDGPNPARGDFSLHGTKHELTSFFVLPCCERLLMPFASSPLGPAATRLPSGGRRGRGARGCRQNGVARKWRRNALKSLNPRSKMVGARKPRTYEIWYKGARLTGAALEWRGTISSPQPLEKAQNAVMFRDTRRRPRRRCAKEGITRGGRVHSRRDLYPRATRCALASQSLWLRRTCAGARLRSRTTSSAITWASAARPRRCSSCA